MKLNIVFDDTYYKSDNIEYGRTARRFVEDLIKNIFDKSYLSYKAQMDFGGSPELPLLHTERNLYSIFAAAIDEITPIHLSEWSLNKTDTGADASRRVDFWCLHKNGVNGKALNYFIELKKNYYCVSEGTNEKFTSVSQKAIDEISDQIRDIKGLKLNWEGDGNVYLGMIITHGYRSGNKDSGYQESTVRDQIYNSLDMRNGSQFLFATWRLPENMPTQWTSDKCDFVAVSTVVITKQQDK